MRVFFIILLLGIASDCRAQTVQVTSGEHHGFSRLFLSFPAQAEWHLGKVKTGYALRLSGEAPLFDLSDVYRRMGRRRLSDIHGEDGTLVLEVKCSCHAMPFELRPGQLAIDIRDGPAPAGSSFEKRLDAKEVTATIPQQPRTPFQSGEALDTRVLNWASGVREASRLPEAAIRLPVQALDTQKVQSQIRAELLWQLSKGATRGLVDMVAGGIVGNPSSENGSTHQLMVADDTKIELNNYNQQAGQIQADGSACIDDQALAIGSWSKDGPVAKNLGLAKSGLVGEFDQPEPDAISKAAHFLLYLGFGAEVRQMLKAFGVKSSEAEMWRAMAHVVDLEPDSTHFFDGMEVCNTAAALWAVLGDPKNLGGTKVAKPAILRAFSALPHHLRRHLGSPLADHFLQRGDISSSRAIQDAILRSGSDLDPSVKLLAAKLKLAAGNTNGGAKDIAEISKTSGPAGIEATIDVANLQASNGGAVSATVTTTLGAFYQEALGGDAESTLRKTLAMAYASQNRFSEAFSLLPAVTDAAAKIWVRLADYGNDSSLIANAILTEGINPPQLPMSSEQRIAERLVDLGFADESIPWLNKSRQNSSTLNASDSILRAKIALEDGNSQSALVYLAGLETTDAELLRARAFTTLGDGRAAASYAKIDAPMEWQQSARHRQAWQELAKLRPGGIWGLTLNLLDKQGSPRPVSGMPTPAENGPISRSRMAVNESIETRKVLARLLSETKVEIVSIK